MVKSKVIVYEHIYPGAALYQSRVIQRRQGQPVSKAEAPLENRGWMFIWPNGDTGNQSNSQFNIYIWGQKP